jgi:hypothetical protein
MARQALNVGSAANDGTGDSLRAAMQKVEANFVELYGGQVNPSSMLASRFVVDSGVLNAQTGTTYTLVAGDNGKVVTLSNASAITLTLPSGLPIGFSVALVQLGAGQVTISPSSTTMRHRSSHTKTAGQYAVANLFSHATNDFLLTGDTA